MNQPLVKVIGYRWVSSRPQTACRACASLHGQEFYFKPKDGQRSVAEMPDPPLHPNCRCTRVEMVAVDLAVLEADASSYEGDKFQESVRNNQAIKPYMSRVAYMGWKGFIWRRGAFFRGPIYGRYGGKLWSYGRDMSGGIAPPDIPPDPEDDMDAIFAQHDSCYDMFETIKCDRRLVNALEGLAEDPRMWRNPPTTEDDIAYAKKYREHAIWWFKASIARFEMRESAKYDLVVAP